MSSELEHLEKHLANYTLTDYVKTLSDEDLQRYLTLVYCDDLVGSRINIAEVLNNEYLYRNQENAKTNEKTTKM